MARDPPSRVWEREALKGGYGIGPVKRLGRGEGLPDPSRSAGCLPWKGREEKGVVNELSQLGKLGRGQGSVRHCATIKCDKGHLTRVTTDVTGGGGAEGALVERGRVPHPGPLRFRVLHRGSP